MGSWAGHAICGKSCISKNYAVISLVFRNPFPGDERWTCLYGCIYWQLIERRLWYSTYNRSKKFAVSAAVPQDFMLVVLLRNIIDMQVLNVPIDEEATLLCCVNNIVVILIAKKISRILGHTLPTKSLVYTSVSRMLDRYLWIIKWLQCSSRNAAREYVRVAK